MRQGRVRAAAEPHPTERPEEDEYIPPGPGLPAFVHWISGTAWLVVGLAALVAVARLDRVGLLQPDREWSLDDGFGLASTAGAVLLVLVPALLLHRRPAAWSEDRALAVAAILVAAGPVLGEVSSFVQRQVFAWLTMSDTFDGSLDLTQAVWALFAVPGWLVAIAAPLLVVRGFDRLDGRPPARFRGATVALIVAAVLLILVSAQGGAVALAASSDAEISIGWTAIAVIPSLALSAAWTWAALAALAGARAGRGRWWLLLLVSAILAGLVPDALMGVGGVAGALAVADDFWYAVMPAVWGLFTLAIAAGKAALAGAFVSVPRAPADVQVEGGEANGA